MTKIKQFEDLEIWQSAREICRMVYDAKQNTNLKNDFKLYNQLNGSSGSIMYNIAEGFERNGNREFIQFLSIAKASCGETRSQIYRAYDRGYLNEDDFDNFTSKVISLSKQINGFINYLQKSDFKGTKFK
ncbi:four helix bundle protein [Zunongwangia atlantica]|uniref:S23 ribosomal protein n=1 Tax=Zunongwangia atlantica 22II14-10F7 TaxID=1185767 RepID=A0A1Y1T687_9FLAO|nr:four helix bundle protein [Zunongwangia atlantica]ORL45943.1 S23 ribosomal protein [Zunongwangia atlantica 22II14-10F7]